MATGLMMKAVTCSNYGDATTVLDINNTYDRPKIGDGQCLIKVMASSMNPIDWKLMKGDYKMIVKKSFPFIPGSDIAGVVEQCGKDVKRFKVGDAVFGDIGLGGAMAEYAPADENCIAMKPPSLSFAEAACIPLAGLTAYQALHVHAKVEKGQKILIIGASGGVGHLACQMAKIAGLNVTGVCSGDSCEMVKSLGADKCIDYKSENWGATLKGQEYNVILDCVGGYETWVQADQNVLAKGGIFVTTVGDEPNNPATVGTIASGAATVMARKIKSNFGEHHRYEVMLKYNGKPEELDAMRAMCETGKLKPKIEKTFSMTKENVLTMFKESEMGNTKGKLCLLVRDDAMGDTSSMGGALKGMGQTSSSDWKM
jgi:NADPH:quinone reductase-like Zn-dependent oxidoreductase